MMVDWPGIVASAVAGALVTLLGAIIAVYVLVERRLSRLETLHEEYPPRDAQARMADLEQEVAVLRPVRDLLLRHGTDAVQEAFRRGSAG